MKRLFNKYGFQIGLFFMVIFVIVALVITITRKGDEYVMEVEFMNGDKKVITVHRETKPKLDDNGCLQSRRPEETVCYVRYMKIISKTKSK